MNTTIATTSYLASGALAKAMLRVTNGIYLPKLTLPNPNFVKRTRVTVPWPENEKQLTDEAIPSTNLMFRVY